MPEKMSELTHIKSISGACKPSMVRTAKVNDSSTNAVSAVVQGNADCSRKCVWLGSVENFGHLLPLKPVATLIPAGRGSLPFKIYTCSILHGTVVTHVHLLHFHFDFYKQKVFTVCAVPKQMTARTSAVISP